MSSFLFFSGRWIFQLPEVDFGARPNRLGHEVHYRWRAVWTGLLNVLVFNFNLICDAALCLSDWCFISYTTTCSDSPAWPETRWLRDCGHQWKQGWIHPVRKMLLLCFVFLSVCVNAVWCWHAVLWLTAWWFSGGLWTEYRSRWLPSRR